MPLWLLLFLALIVVATWLAGWVARRSIRRHDAPRPALPTGREVAERIVETRDLGKVVIEEGDVDSYVAGLRTIRLADGRLERRSISAMAVAAHEAAHTLQHATAYRPWRIWWALAIPALIAGVAIVPAIALALVFGSAWLVWVVILLLLVIAVAGVVSCIVEVDASSRAMGELRLRSQAESLTETITGADLLAARRVLTACAATYVAETVLDIGFVLRWLGRDGDDATPDRAGDGGPDFGGGDSGGADFGGGGGFGGGGDG